jgi:hypothetical protein
VRICLTNGNWALNSLNQWGFSFKSGKRLGQ